MGETLKPCPREKRHFIHGHTVNKKYSPTYHSWQAMLARCRYEARDTDKKHIGRGISVDKRWLNFGTFLSDMGERPEGTTLDRIDNNGDYESRNCKWSTPTEQARNRRNSRLTFEQAFDVAIRMNSGETAKSVAEIYGCSESLPREIAKRRTWKDAHDLAVKFMEGRDDH